MRVWLIWYELNIVDAMVKYAPKRLLVISVVGPGTSISMVPPQQVKALGRLIALKEEAESHFMASDLEYTIIRPGQLTTPRSGIIRMYLQ